MSFSRIDRRRSAAAGVIAALALGMLGCAAEADPEPTPTAAFSSEEEAFAAAEQVYRDYNDAGNARRNGKDEPDPQKYLIGQALEGDLDALSYLNEQGVHIDGDVELLSFTGLTAIINQDDAIISALVCLDAGATRVLTSDGTDVTPQSREDVLAQRIELRGNSNSLQIAQEDAESAESC